ncbi:radical SAM protein [bacterium]|nr:radical SAM protein [bacterium]MBP5434403.1 radical SAM protein [bacterium]
MKISEVKSKSILVKSNLPASDYVANPYTGCTHRCLYCYASFMKRFTGHDDEWGTFIDIKNYESEKLPKNLSGKVILLSSVTDPYNPYEVKYHKSRDVLEKLVSTDADVEILSKSDLMVNDIDLLKRFRHLKVGISLCTLDDVFRYDMEPGAPSVERRLAALKKLHDAGISTYLMMSPIFPYITDVSALAEAVRGSVDQICFENLNLRGGAKAVILNYVKEKYPQYYADYVCIYNKNDITYWIETEEKIEKLSKDFDVPFVNYFYHAKIRKNNGRSHD